MSPDRKEVFPLSRKILDCYQVPVEMDYMLSMALGTPLPEISSGFEWNKFFSFVSKNRLKTLVSAGAAKLSHPPEQLLQLKTDADYLTVKTLQQIQALAFLAAEFQASGIRMLSMKGPLLAAAIYGDPSLRYSGDLDLLVPEEDFQTAKARLISAGYSECIDLHHQTEKRRKICRDSGEEMHEVFKKGDLCVELHWRISFRYPVSFEELWTNREQRMLLGQEINCLGDLDNLIYLICHAAGHGYSRLRWLTDLYELFKNGTVNYTELFQEMKNRDAQTFLLETLLLLYLIPGFRMPGISSSYFSIRGDQDYVYFSYEEEIKTEAIRACHLTDLLEPLLLKETDPSGIPERNYMHLLPVVGKRVTAFSYLYKLMQPRRAELERFHFPDSLYFLYYIVRPFYKLWRYTPFYKGEYR